MVARERLAGLPLPLLLVAGWGVLMRTFGVREVYLIMGLYALLVSALVLVAFRSQARSWFRAGQREIAVGIGLGLLMTGLTYPLYDLAHALVPELSVRVAALYRSSNKESALAALPWVLVILSAEELLFRGALLRGLERHMGRRAALLVSVCLYAGAQACSGSLIVALLALCCGTIWTLERMLTGSLIAPLLSHMIWTPTVILLRPVMD